MKKLTIFAAALALVSAAATSCSSSGESKADSAVVNEEVQETIDAVADTVAALAAKEVVNLKDDNKFRPDTKVDQVTVLDFNAVWCVPCKKLTPAFEKAAEELGGEVAFYSVDIDSLKATAEAFKVQSVPTVVIMTPAGETKTIVGLGEFTQGAEATTDVIFGNLVKIIADQKAK